MKSIFRIYAKTSKGNDNYLYNELTSLSLKPKYQDLMHSFYFDATFADLFRLSFNSYTVQNMYIQLGHKFPVLNYSPVPENQRTVLQSLKKINFRNYLPMSRNLISNITVNYLIRESSAKVPSEAAITSILQNYLQKQIIMREYKKMGVGARQKQDGQRMLQNYYDIKGIVEKLWEHRDSQRQKIELLLEDKSIKRLIKSSKDIEQYNQKQKQIQQLNRLQQPTYNPHLLFYIRRNHGRILLKLNKESMHKFGWKTHIGWGPIRESLTACILYKSGLLQKFKKDKQIRIWDPFCGSGTMPLVGLAMGKGLMVREDVQSNFVWHNWPIFKQQYLDQFKNEIKKQNQDVKVNVLASDIDIKAVNAALNNFKSLISLHKDQLKQNQDKFINIKPNDSIFQLIKNSVVVGCDDFQAMASKILTNKQKKANIITNLPYLGERSKQHINIKQLNSIYKRFNTMIQKYKQYIDNIFVIVDSQTDNSNHFLKMGNQNQQWRILTHFSNGGIEVVLLGWDKNTCSFQTKDIVLAEQKKQLGEYTQQKGQNLQEYRQQMKKLQSKRYDLPKFMIKSKSSHGVRRVRQKKKQRHLRAAYVIFAKRRDRDIVFAKYARKNLALKLAQRGSRWMKKNTSILQGKLQQHQQVIKKQFETRIEQALKRSQQIKNRKKGKEQPTRKW